MLQSRSISGWLGWLKQKNTTSVVLHYQPSNQNDIPDRYTGKEQWIIEVSQKGILTRWDSKLDFVGKPPETRTWKVTYKMISRSEFPLQVSSRLSEEIRQELSAALVEIYQFAKENKEEYFANLFSRSLDVLDMSNPSEQVLHKDLVPSGYSLGARQVLAACETANVFGGMGSWNDGIDYPFANDRDRYNIVSENLFQAICNSIVSAINSY
jgi:hypothetical protein